MLKLKGASAGPTEPKRPGPVEAVGAGAVCELVSRSLTASFVTSHMKVIEQTYSSEDIRN